MILLKKQLKILYELLLEEKPQLADAIIWLQGDRYDRASRVWKLYRDGWAKQIIISGNNRLLGDKIRPGENNISLDSMKRFLLKKGVIAKNLIIDDMSMNTKEQAVHILKLAKAKRWTRLILVGSSYYQPRAFLTFLKQAENIAWRGRILNQPQIVNWNKVPGGRSETAKIIFNKEFKKIENYKKDLVSIGRGIAYLSKGQVNLRKVTKDDVKLLFFWANDVEARANARNPKQITWKEHVVWFNNRLHNPGNYMYILTNLLGNIGIVRFEQKEGNFVISYLIDKQYRGLGLGGFMLKEGMKKINKIVKRPNFIAYVKKGNIASEKIFNKLGFIFKKEEILNKVKFNIYQK